MNNIDNNIDQSTLTMNNIDDIDSNIQVIEVISMSILIIDKMMTRA